MDTNRRIPRSRAIICISVCATALLALLSYSCAGGVRERAAKAPDPARVEAHSAGLIPAGSGVKVVLTKAAGETGAAAPKGVFRFFPSVSGKATWDDERTVSFVPDRPLVPGKRYRVEVDMSAIGAGTGVVAGVAGSDYFSFDIVAAKQRVAVETLPPRVARDGSILVEGTVRLTNGLPDAVVERGLSASAGMLAWNHESDKLHRFTVSGIASSKLRSIALRWNLADSNGASAGKRARGATVRGQAVVKLPSASSFELIGARKLDEASGSKGIELAFSRPVAKTQDLRGLVSVEGVQDLRYTITGSIVSLYSEAWPASATVRVEKGLRDADGGYLATPAAATVAFDWEKPLVRFITKGNILPTDQGLVLPIETMNLSGVVIETLRVYGDNMLQFLQVNDLDTTRELKRVGEVVWHKRFDLGWKDDWKNRWVRQGLDLGPLLAAQKDGMFQIRLTFRVGDIRYVGPNNHDFKDLKFPDDTIVDSDEGESSFWDYVQQWAGGYDDYDKYKDDPLHPAYYLPYGDHDITIRRNVVVSDIGAAIKRDVDGAWHVAASDLRTAKPLAGATVTLYNFQRRSLVSGQTASTGLVTLRTQGEPYFATAQMGAQTSWLKVDEGSSLAVGHFDIGGEQADSGLKGFIYGERGVWRPGDAIHLSFILYDRTGKLPAKFPIAFELEDPLGRIVRTGGYSDSVNGFYAIDAATTQDAPTGTYVARVTAGGRTFTKNLKIETVMPNRLKLTLDWGGAPYISTDTDSMTLSASWLTGAKAGALKADVSATFAAAGTTFTTLPDYTFDDPTRTASSDRVVLFDDRLGSDGSASFAVDLNADKSQGSNSSQGSSSSQPPGKLTANILTRVFEPSGVFSSETASVDFHPYEHYAGLRLPKGDAARGMLLVDKDQRVDLALVDRDGKLVKGGGTVDVALYQLDWRWWWEKGDESLAQRADELYQRPIKKDTVTIGPDGRGSWTFQVKYPSWGRYLVRVEDKQGGHAAGKIVYIDWPGWAGRGRDSGGAEAMLELTVGAPKYAPGDKASVSFPSNENGSALVQIERAGRILREEWVPTKKETTAYSFAVTPDMAPNVYVHVTFVQPHLQTANDLPIRLYGIVPVMVEDPATRVRPILTTPATLAPEGQASFTVREEKGRPMTYTVAVVDEGLLGITRYQTPDPWNEFYKKEASSLSAWDLYQYVAGAFSGKLETLLAVGGSDEALGAGNRKPSRFPAVVYYFPPRELKAGETASMSFKLGTYIGALRFMVVAATMPSQMAAGAAAGGSSLASGAAFGAAEQSVPVRADIMGQLTAPRVLSPGEEASIPATVFAFMGAKKATVTLKASGALSLVGGDTQTLGFKQDGDLSAMFRVKAAASPGMGNLKLVAAMEGKSAQESIDIEVRSVAAAVATVTGAVVNAGSTWKAPLDLPGEKGTNSLSVELSRLKPIDLAERVDWLIQYPHGCAEQTTSGAFPQLYLSKAVSLAADKAAAARDNVAAAIVKLRGFQTERGGFSMWPGEGDEDDWITAYVTHFLLASRKEGFDVPQGLVDPAVGYLARSSRGWNSTEAWSQSVQAYRLYDLALAGAPEIAAMNRFRDFPGIPTAARFRLAAAYAMAGMRDAASALVRGLSSDIAAYPGMVDNTYGTEIRDRAVVLDALNALGDTDRALPVYNKLADDLDSRRWLSTQDLGAALGAALPYAILAASSDAPMAAVSLDGSGKSSSVKLDKPMARIELPAPDGVQASVTVANSGATPLFARILARGRPAPGNEKPTSNGLSLSIRYLGMDGKAVDPAKAEAGADMIVEATVRNRSGQALKNLALSQLMPSGWEIVDFRPAAELPKPAKNDGGDQGDAEDSGAPTAPHPPLFDYQDVRDDRVLTYFSMNAKEPKVFKIYVTKTYEGNFFLPATTVSAMYEQRFQALIPGRWLGPRSGQQPERAGQ